MFKGELTSHTMTKSPAAISRAVDHIVVSSSAEEKDDKSQIQNGTGEINRSGLIFDIRKSRFRENMTRSRCPLDTTMSAFLPKNEAGRRASSNLGPNRISKVQKRRLMKMTYLRVCQASMERRMKDSQSTVTQKAFDARLLVPWR